MKMAKLVRTGSGRQIKKPREIYFQNCVLKATIMENARAKKRPAERVKKCREKKKEKEMARMLMEEKEEKKKDEKKKKAMKKDVKEKPFMKNDVKKKS